MDEAVQWVEHHSTGGIGIAIKAFIVIAIAAVIYAVFSFIMGRIVKRYEGSKHHWKWSLALSARAPISLSIWLLALTWAGEFAISQVKNPVIHDAISPIREVGIIAVCLWFVLRFIKQIEYVYLNQTSHKTLDAATIRAIARLSRIVLVLVTVLVTLQTVGISITGLVAFGGIGAAGIAFASQDLLGNFFGGILVYVNRPFSVGDWINSPEKQIEGTVEEIGWLLTRIRAFDKRPIYVPNAIFTKIPIVNPSRMTNRRIKTLVGVRYGDAAQVGNISAAIEAMLRTHEDIDQRQTIFVALVEFADSSLNIQIYCFTKTKDWVPFQMIQQDVFLKIIAIIQEHGADIAFPTRTLDTPDTFTIKGPEHVTA